MARLVDADEIKKRERDVVLANGAKHRCFDTTMLFEIPTVDAVEVVRCKDCVYYKAGWCCNNEHIEVESAFCSWGVRKDEVTECTTVT